MNWNLQSPPRSSCALEYLLDNEIYSSLTTIAISITFTKKKFYVLALWKGLLSFLARCLFLLAHLGEIGLIQTFTSIVDEDFIYHSEVLNSGVQNVMSVDIGIQEAKQAKSTCQS